MSDAKRDCIRWHPVCTVEKYSPDQAAWARRELPARRPLHGNRLRELFREPEGGIALAVGNGVTAGGLANLALLLTGTGGHPLAPGRAVFGVGTDAETEFSPDLVHLAHGPGEGFGRSWYRPMDDGFPESRGAAVAGQATFGEREACFTWAEWCWATGRPGAVAGPVLRLCYGGEGEHVMLNRKAPESGFGVKELGAAWVFQTEIRFELFFSPLVLRYAGRMPVVKYPDLQDPEWLRERYIRLDLTMYEIAGQLGCSDVAVYQALKRHGIKIRTKRRQHTVAKFKPKPCRGCRETFQPRASCHLYCDECRAPRSGKPRARHLCGFCQEFFRPRGRRWSYYATEFCSPEHRVAFLRQHGGKAARRRVNKDGYVEIRVGKGYPGARATGYMLEHRYVMEQQLGRCLYPHEEVHHRYGQRADNQPDQLELWSTSQPSGQRVEDKIAWALEFLGQYGTASFEREITFRDLLTSAGDVYDRWCSAQPVTGELFSVTSSAARRPGQGVRHRFSRRTAATQPPVPDGE